MDDIVIFPVTQVDDPREAETPAEHVAEAQTLKRRITTTDGRVFLFHGDDEKLERMYPGATVG